MPVAIARQAAPGGAGYRGILMHHDAQLEIRSEPGGYFLSVTFRVD